NFTGAIESFTERNINTTVAGSLERFAPIVRRAKDEGMWVRSYLSVAFGCPYEGEVDGDAVVGLRDLAAVSRNLGRAIDEDPVLVERITQLESSIDTVEARIIDWSVLFDLSPDQLPGGPAALTASLPVVEEDLASVLDLGSALADAVPDIQVTGAGAALRNQLTQLGFSILRFPGGPEGGPDNTDLRVRYTGTIDGLTGQSSFARSDVPDLPGLHAASALDGTIDYGRQESSSTVELDLVMGVDDSGFYLLGESEIRLLVDAAGDVSGSFDLPLPGLSIAADGVASAQYVVSLTQTDPAFQLRTGDLDGDPADIWTVGVDGDARVDVALEYVWQGERSGQAVVGSSWSIAVVDGTAGPVTGGIATPDPDQFFEAVLPILDENLNLTLNDDLAALFDAINLPFVDEFGPGEWIADLGANDSQSSQIDASLIARFRRLLGNPFSNLDERGQGLFYTTGDTFLRADQLRTLYDIDGSGVTIGVFSDGVAGLDLLVDSGDLPPLAEMEIKTDGDGKRISRGGEGTAMLELIHDIAPGAKLAFAGHDGTRNGYENAIQWLVETAKADIIVSDVLSFDSVYTPSDAAALMQRYMNGDFQDARGNTYDPLFVMSAGNIRNRHYSGQASAVEFQTPTGTRQLHQFANVDGTPFPLLPIILPSRKSTSLKLTWDEPFTNPIHSPTLRLFKPTNAGPYVATGDTPALDNLVEVASATRTTYPKGEAIARFDFTNTGPSQVYYVAVDFGTVAPESNFDLTIIDKGQGQILLGLDNPGSSEGNSIVAEAAVPGVLTVGAIDVPLENGDPILEQIALNTPYFFSGVMDSSQVVQTPENPNALLNVMAYSNVAISGIGLGTKQFPGTSAAAPQVAAVAALLKSLRNDATPEELIVALQRSAIDLVGGLQNLPAGADRASGYGRVDALDAATWILASGQQAQASNGSPATAAGLGAGPGHEPSETLIERLNQVDGWQVGTATAEELLGLLTGDNLGPLELVSIHVTTSPDAFAEETLRYGIALDEVVPALAGAGLEASLDVGVRPRFDLQYGLDSSGFYFDPNSTLAVELNGRVTGTGQLELFDVELGGAVRLTPELRIDSTDTNQDGKIRPAEFLANLGQLRPGLIGDVQVELTTDLKINFLDYVDVDPRIPNEPFASGDPFILSGFVEAFVDPNLDGEGNFQFAVTDWGLRNPDIDGDGIDDYTTAILAENVIQFARNQLLRPGAFFGPDGQLAEALGSFEVPMVGGTLADIVPLDILPDFDTGFLQAIGDVGAEVLDQLDVLEILSFDAINDLMRTGTLPAGEELVRLKFNLDGIELGFVDELQAALGDLLPDAIDPTGLLRLDEWIVEITRIVCRFTDRLFGDLVEYHSP
ncbi:MAG: S8 family serine peptidase, partial [Pirellulales bacterium]